MALQKVADDVPLADTIEDWIIDAFDAIDAIEDDADDAPLADTNDETTLDAIGAIDATDEDGADDVPLADTNDDEDSIDAIYLLDQCWTEHCRTSKLLYMTCTHCPVYKQYYRSVDVYVDADGTWSHCGPLLDCPVNSDHGPMDIEEKVSLIGPSSSGDVTDNNANGGGVDTVDYSDDLPLSALVKSAV